MRVTLVLTGFLLFLLTSLEANNFRSKNTIKQDSLPPVFLLGEHESAFEQLNLKYSTMLLEACNDDMQIAFNKWLGMIQAIEAFAEKDGYDLKGIKLWMNVFWEKDGSIKHIAYFLKPTSRNVNTNGLTVLFENFSKEYTLSLTNNENYSHYGSASFPLVCRKKVELNESQIPDDPFGNVEDKSIERRGNK